MQFSLYRKNEYSCIFLYLLSYDQCIYLINIFVLFQLPLL